MKLRKIISQAYSEAFSRRILSLPPELRNINQVDKGLVAFEARWGTKEVESEDDAPIFIFSAGWRSGSTLLQRLICSSGEVVVWGESLGNSAIVPRLAETMMPFSNGWPPDEFFADKQEKDKLASSWIANVTPGQEYFREAHRAFFETWLKNSADNIYGTSRWGLKEVRLTIEHARYLKWLFPQSKFLFIYRNLFDAYKSWRGNLWGDTWPGYYSWSPIAYARHWKLLLSGYMDGCDDIGGRLIKYEDLVAGRIDLDDLSKYLNIKEIDRKVLDERIASPKKGRKRKGKWLSPIEKLVLRLVASKELKRAGYIK